MEHAQEYYNVSSAMLSDLMKDIATENLETHITLHMEEDELKRQFKPLHVWITSASMPTCYSLLPILATGEVFGPEKAIWLHLLDNSQSMNTLEGLKMEVEDLAFPCIREVSLHTMADDAFLHADFVIVLDDALPKDDQSPEDYIKMVAEQCTQYGDLIDQNANKEVKVVVAGSTYSNLKALMMLKNAPSIHPNHVVALPTQLEFEAKAQIAQKLNINSSVVKDVIVWGNISGINYLDLNEAKVYKYNSSIWGPPSYSRPLLDVMFDRKWMKSDLEREWKFRRNHRSGLSAAHSIASVLSWWQQHLNNGEIVSLGVISKGHFDLPDEIFYSMPVQFKDGNWKVYTQIDIHEDVRKILQEAASELIKEKHIALGIPQNEQAIEKEEKIIKQEEQTIEEDTQENGNAGLKVLFPDLKASLHEHENLQIIQETNEETN
uniref:Putative malate dehydrogenase 1B n=2 Tax=Pyxicephalus adspersus TaxID=30357 RepID=A0AAV3A9E3_PYXAD|nr:TPA: hypothetical protein GDO54_015781 [Pyxicephalus adspersus]